MYIFLNINSIFSLPQRQLAQQFGFKKHDVNLSEWNSYYSWQHFMVEHFQKNIFKTKYESFIQNQDKKIKDMFNSQFVQQVCVCFCFCFWLFSEIFFFFHGLTLFHMFTFEVFFFFF